MESSSLVPLAIEFVEKLAKFTLDQIKAEKAKLTEALILSAMEPFVKGRFFKKVITRNRASAEIYVDDCRTVGQYRFPNTRNPFFHRISAENKAKDFISAVRYARGGIVYFTLEDAKWITVWERDYIKFHDSPR